MNKRKGIIIALVLMAVGGCIWLLSGASPKHQVTFVTAKVSRGEISNSVTATGTVEPVTQVEVGTQVSGIISRLFADYNSQVTKGQIIAELDKANLLNEHASKKSSLASARSEYEYQLKNYTRAKALHEKTLVADTDYEEALYNYERARNAYDVSKNDLAKAETNLGYATIYSPIDGVVLSRAVEEGQTVNAGMSTPTLFTIANDLTDMQVVANVDEADIGGVEEGQRVGFTVDAYPNDTFEGRVTQVRQEATTTSNVVTYEVVISAPNPDLKLKPGLTANVTIYTLEKRAVLTVPSKALRFSPVPPFVGAEDRVVDSEQETSAAEERGKSATEKLGAHTTEKPSANSANGLHKLWTREGRTFTAHVVEVGITNGIVTEIISGIPEGTVVVSDANLGQLPGEVSTEQVGQAQESQTEKSPFMPGRPGGNQKKK